MCHTLAWPLKKTVQIPVLGNSIGSIGPRTRYFDLLQKHSTNSIKAGMSSYFSMTKQNQIISLKLLKAPDREFSNEFL